MKFEWDEEKAALNLGKHGLDFEFAKLIFAGPVLEGPDNRQDYGEARLVAIGTVDGFEIVVVFTWREEARRLISARRANAKERKAYHQAFPGRSRS
ncbi:MAG: BrnT family toxin [Stellaceae bacterium]